MKIFVRQTDSIYRAFTFSINAKQLINIHPVDIILDGHKCFHFFLSRIIWNLISCQHGWSYYAWTEWKDGLPIHNSWALLILKARHSTNATLLKIMYRFLCRIYLIDSVSVFTRSKAVRFFAQRIFLFQIKLNTHFLSL